MYNLSTYEFLKSFYFDINTYNLIRKGSINCHDDEQTNTKINLLPYQNKTVLKMSFMENGGKFYYKSNYITTKMGILGNKSGSGKSFCILERILNQTMLPKKILPKKILGNFVKIFQRDLVYLKANIIVLPLMLLNQWTMYITNYTHLKTIIIDHNQNLKILLENILHNDNDIILIVDTIFNKFSEYINSERNNLIFSRIVFDNADSLNIKNCAELKASFTWFVTSNPENLIFLNNIVYELHTDVEVDEDNYQELISSKLIKWKKYEGFSHRGYIYRIFKHLYMNRFLFDYKSILIKCSDNLIDNLNNLPKYHSINLKCYIPKFVKYIVKYSNITLQDIEADDKIVFEKFKFFYNYKNLFTSLEKNNKNPIRIQELKKNIIKNDDTKTCPICYNNLNKPIIITPCCYHQFHIECLYKLCQDKKIKCPLCLTKFSLEQCYYIDNLSVDKPYLSKLNRLTNLITKLNGKTLIYISKSNLKMLNHRHNLRNKFIIRSFEKELKNIDPNHISNSKFKFFYINTLNKINGIHCKHFDNIIITQQLSKSITDSIINIANVVGRKKNLNIFNLVYSN